MLIKKIACETSLQLLPLYGCHSVLHSFLLLDSKKKVNNYKFWDWRGKEFKFLCHKNVWHWKNPTALFINLSISFWAGQPMWAIACEPRLWHEQMYGKNSTALSFFFFSPVETQCFSSVYQDTFMNNDSSKHSLKNIKNSPSPSLSLLYLSLSSVPCILFSISHLSAFCYKVYEGNLSAQILSE